MTDPYRGRPDDGPEHPQTDPHRPADPQQAANPSADQVAYPPSPAGAAPSQPPAGYPPPGYPPPGYASPPGYPPPGYPSPGYPPGGYPPPGYPQGGYPPPGYPQGGPPAPGYSPQAGPPAAGHPQPVPYGPPPGAYGMPAYGHPGFRPYYPAPLPAMPLEPVRYTHLLRGPRFRWWKPLLTFALALGLFLGFSMLTVVPPLVVGLVRGVPNLGQYVLTTLTDIDNLGPTGFVALNLSLVVLIPTAMLSVWIVYGVRPRFLSSVLGGLRWRWLLRCLVVLLPLWVLYVGSSLFAEQPPGGRPPYWVALLVIVVLMTPFQAAGEEYIFRGWLMQNIGAWFAKPMVGLVVATVVSALTFSAAHGSFDIWIFGSVACLAVAACIATWWTGGLEAAIVMHAVNNVLAFFVTITLGGFQDAFIQSDTQGTPLMFVLSILVHGIALVLIRWQAKRAGIEPMSRPRGPQQLPAGAQQPELSPSAAPVGSTT